MSFIMNTLVNASLAAIAGGIIYGLSKGTLTPVNAGLIGAVTGILHTFGVMKGLLKWVLSGILLNTVVLGAIFAYVKVYWTTPLTEEEKQRREVDYQEAQAARDAASSSLNPNFDPSAPTAPKLRSASPYTVQSRDKPIASFMTIRRTFEVGGKDATAPATAGSGVVSGNTLGSEGETSDPIAPRTFTEAWSNSRETPAAQALAAQAGGQPLPSSSTMTSKAYSMFTTAYKNIQDRSTSPSESGTTTPKAYIQATDFTKDMWIKLDGNVLFIYDDETMSSPRGALPISEYTISISNGASDGSGKMKEGQLFNKKNAIVLTPPSPPARRGLRDRTLSSDSVRMPTRRSTKSSLGGKSMAESIGASSSVASIAGSDVAAEVRTRSRAGSTASSAAPSAEDEADARRKRQERRDRESRRAQAEAQPYYLFLRNPAKMEFWYHRLLQASSKPPTKREIFPLGSWGTFVDELENAADPSQMRGLNAFIGRLFCAYSQTALIEALIVDKIHAKIKKSHVHWMAGDITVREFVVGTRPPRFSKLVLKEITKDGGITLNVDIKYEGELSVHIGTQAQFSMGFKRVGLNVEAKATLRSISGTLMIKINPPPSNRLWYAFTTTPAMDLRVEPIISATKLAHPTVLGQIDKLIRNAIGAAVVLPNMDDLSFFNTSTLAERGGIFDAAARTKVGIPVASSVSEDGVGMVPVREEDATSRIGLGTLDSPINGNRVETENSRMTSDAVSQKDKVAPLGIVDTQGDIPQGVQAGRGWFAARQAPQGGQSDVTASIRSGNQGDSTTISRPASIPPRENQAPNVGSSSNVEGFSKNRTSDLGKAESLTRAGTADAGRNGLGMASSTSVDAIRSASGPSQTAMSGHRTASSTSSVTSTEAWSQPKQDILNGTSAAALMQSLRAKAADKEALQTSVNQARDAMKKWGTGWAAKHRAFAPPPRDPVEESRPLIVPPPPPPQADEIRSTPLQITKAPDPLQRRLAAVAQLATSPERPKTLQPQSVPAMAVPRIPRRPSAEAATLGGAPEAGTEGPARGQVEGRQTEGLPVSAKAPVNAGEAIPIANSEPLNVVVLDDKQAELVAGMVATELLDNLVGDSAATATPRGVQVEGSEEEVQNATETGPTGTADVVQPDTALTE